MGRLTLNILLSFAQFEREVTASASATSSRPAARRACGWAAIRPGYEVEDRKLVIDDELRPPSSAGSSSGSSRSARPRSWRAKLPKQGVPDAAREADRQGLPLQAAEQPGLHRRGRAQGHELSRRARGDHRPRDLGQGPCHPAGKPPQARGEHPRADAGPAQGADLRPDGAALSPTHTRKGGRLYRYYVSQTVLKHGAGACPVARVPAAEIEAAVIDQLRGMLRAPEIVVATWRAAQPDCEGFAEDEVRKALAELDPLWDELFPAEQARIVQLLVERVEIGTDGLKLRFRDKGITHVAAEVGSMADKKQETAA